MFIEPKACWQPIDLSERRTAIEFAEEMGKLVDLHYPEAEKKITVVRVTTRCPFPNPFRSIPLERGYYGDRLSQLSDRLSGAKGAEGRSAKRR